MNGTIKIILGLIAGITLVCLILGISGLLLFQSTVETVVQASPVEVKFEEHAPEEIADYALPSGFGDKFTLQLGGYSLVGYTGDDGHSHIYLAQADASTGVTLDAIEGWIQNPPVPPANPSSICTPWKPSQERSVGSRSIW